MNNRLGRAWCAIIRKLGNGRHKYRDNICVRCGAVKRKAKTKGAKE